MGQVLTRAIPRHDMEKYSLKQLWQGYWQCLCPATDPRRARQDWLPGYKGSMSSIAVPQLMLTPSVHQLPACSGGAIQPGWPMVCTSPSRADRVTA